MRVVAARSLPGAPRKVEVVEVWQAIERIAGFGGGFGSLTTVRVWTALLLMREPSSGVVDMDRNDLAGLVGISAARISRILTALEKANMVQRRREGISGTRGPGKVVITIP